METFHLWNDGLIISPRKRFPLRKKYSLQQQNCVQLIFPYLPCNRTMGLPSPSTFYALVDIAVRFFDTDLSLLIHLCVIEVKRKEVITVTNVPYLY